MTLTGGQAILETLRPEPVRAVYGLVGGKLGPVLKAIAATPSLRYVGTRHEAASGYMAAAHYARHGEIALVLSELGSGATNVVGAIASAYNNRLPLLLITSNNQHSVSYPQRGMFMETDLHALLRPITKWNAVIHDVRRIPELIRTALREALTGRPGPVHLDIPQDVLRQSCDYPDGTFDLSPAQYRPLIPPVAPAAALAQAADLLRTAERPLLIAGGGLAQSGNCEAFRQLAKVLDAAVISTQRGIGALSTDDPRFIGHGGVIGGDAVLQALREADVVLSLGCRFSSWLWDAQGPMIRPPQRLIQVDTDAAMLGAATPAALTLQSDAAAAAASLLALLTPSPAAAPRPWCAALSQTYQAYRARLAALDDGADPVMHPATLAAAIAAAVPKDALVTLDGGHTSFWSNDVTHVAQPRQVFHEPGLAQLGFSLPYAIALQLAEPDRLVVNITGDGAFGFTAMELDTARRYAAPVITFIHNNASWGVIRAGQSRENYAIGTDLTGTDYAALARGLSCHGEQVDHPDQVAPAYARARASGLPAVIDCRTRFVPHPMMAAFGATNMVGL
jgi:thiamine pyrophosphate-dependent acetolactate synthase large subunit-like protein